MATTVAKVECHYTTPLVAFVWQFVTIGGFVGALVAYRFRVVDRDYDTFSMVTRWSGIGLIVGFVALLIRGLS